MAKRYYSFEETHQTVKGMKLKRCTQCQKWKDENQYYKSRRKKDGLQWRCKECEREYYRKHYEKIRNTGRRNIRSKDRYRVVNGVKQKYCRKCNRWKKESEFYKDRSQKDGLSGQCKKCLYKSTKKTSK